MGGEPDRSRVVDDTTKSGLVRALSVLDHLRARTPQSLGVTTIARDLGLSKAVTYRILKDFTASEYLEFDVETKQYRLGPRAFQLGLAALRALDIPALARPHLDALVKHTEETATLSIRQGWSRVYLDQVESPREIRMAVQLGGRHSLHAGSSSKAILSAMRDDEIASFLEIAGSLALTPGDEAERFRLQAEIATTRARGWAMSIGERQAGAASVAAPIYAASGEVWGSISVCGPRERFNSASCDEFGPLVVAAARDISGGVAPFASLPDMSTKQ